MKQQRHSAIRDVLVNANIPSQDELRTRLARRGFHVTQATLSRDIRELHLSKGPTGYQFPAEPDNDLPSLSDVLQALGLEARQALNLLVLITRPGGAQPIAAAIDYEAWPEIVGTLAGDDTVLIICPDLPRANTLHARLEALLA